MKPVTSVLLTMMVLIGSSVAAFADDACSNESRHRIWIPDESIATSKNWSSGKAPFPVVVFNGRVINPDVAPTLSISMVGGFHHLGADIDKDVFTLDIKDNGIQPNMDHLFQPLVTTVIFFLDRPDGKQISLRNSNWLGAIVRSMGLSQSVSEQIFNMSEQNCFRGAMLFGANETSPLSLLIWNSAAIDQTEAQTAPCLLSAFVAKTGMDWSVEDRLGRHFLNAC